MHFLAPALNNKWYLGQLAKLATKAPILQRMVYDEKRRLIRAGDERVTQAYEMPYDYLAKTQADIDELSRKDSLALI